MIYKVIKEFGSAKKGDILSYEDNLGLYTLDIHENGVLRYMAMDEDTADDFVQSGNLRKIVNPGWAFISKNKASNTIQDKSTAKLQKIDSLVNDLIDQYTKDNNIINEKYNNQEIPTCVKVEADTVHANLTKVLNKIRNIINE